MLVYPTEHLDAIRNVLVDSHRTVAVAESVTAGLLQNAFSQATDARLFFQGGMTVYNVGVAVVGYAAPVPEKSVEDPFAWYAIYSDEQLLEAGRIGGVDGGPLDNQFHYVQAVIAAVHRVLCF